MYIYIYIYSALCIQSDAKCGISTLHSLINWLEGVQATRAARESILANQYARSRYILSLSLSLSFALSLYTYIYIYIYIYIYTFFLQPIER